MAIDYSAALWLGNANIGYGGWTPQNRKWIIVHKTAGDATIEAVQRTFEANSARDDPTSTHYAVGEDGRVGQYVPEASVAWGNGPITGVSGVAVAGRGNAHDAWWDSAYPGNANPPTFSIEHCTSDTSNSAALTPAQQAASFALIKHLCDRWNIPYHVYSIAPYSALATGGVTGHFSMDPQNRAYCPGTYPWQALHDYLNGGSKPVSIVLEHNAAGTIVAAHDADNPAMRVSQGIAQKIADMSQPGLPFKPWTGAEIEVSTDDMSKEQLPSGVKIAILRGDAKVAITWSPAGGIETSNGDTVAAMQDLYYLWQAAKNAPAPKPPVDIAADVSAIETALSDIKAKVAA